jgi:hypothetical protein
MRGNIDVFSLTFLRLSHLRAPEAIVTERIPHEGQ